MSENARRPRLRGDRRDRYPLLAEWMEADRRDAGLGGRVTAWLAGYRRDRTTGPTWYAVAEFVRPDLDLLPAVARCWYASQLINRLIRQGWLVIAGPGPGGTLEPGPLAEHDLEMAGSPEPETPPPGVAVEPESVRWSPGRLF